jgi:hypothetical protein
LKGDPRCTPPLTVLPPPPGAVVIAALALSGPALAASAASHPSIAGPAAGPTTQGIIMKDGQICDPIRHMGC